MNIILALLLGWQIGIPTERSYKSDTVEVHLIEGGPHASAIDLLERGDADFIVVYVFYYDTFEGQKILLHKETTTPVLKGLTVSTDIPLPMKDVAFIRVHELKLLNQNDFGKDK